MLFPISNADDLERFAYKNNGGMSEIYRGINRPDLGLKVVRPEVRGFASYQEALRREAITTSYLHGIDPDHFLAIHKITEITGIGLGIVMEWIDGPDLREHIQEADGLSSSEVAHIGAHALSAAHRIHTSGGVHRDLNHGNIMIGKGSRVVVIDLGIVEIEGIPRLTFRSDVVGKPRYISPQQCMGGDPDPRDDLYSLGISLFEAFTCKVTFRCNSLDGRRTLLKNEPMPRPRFDADLDVDPELRNIVYRLMEPELDQRYQNAWEPACDMAKVAVRLNENLRTQEPFATLLEPQDQLK